jgi:hypothetical protein
VGVCVKRIGKERTSKPPSIVFNLQSGSKKYYGGKTDRDLVAISNQASRTGRTAGRFQMAPKEI